MRQNTRLLSVLALAVGMAAGATAMAADLPKEGTFNGTFPAVGAIKGYPVGKEQTPFQWEADGLSVGNGFLDHLTWHCFGAGDVLGGMETWSGYCILTDTAGDQIATDASADAPYDPAAKTFPASGKLLSGTGKYAGISGSIKFVAARASDFRMANPSNYIWNATVQANYKLP